MRFVATKTPEQQSCLTLHRTHHLFIRQQTSVINAILTSGCRVLPGAQRTSSRRSRPSVEPSSESPRVNSASNASASGSVSPYATDAPHLIGRCARAASGQAAAAPA